MEKINHFSHQRHSLTLLSSVSDPNLRLNCSICNRLIHVHQQYYACNRCYYLIHKTCAELKQHIKCSLHDLHPLTLLKRSTSESTVRCYYCEKPFGDESYAYKCNQCAFFMHMTCALIPLPTIKCDGGEDHDNVQFVCHQNPMKLVEHGGSKDGVEANKCFACQLPWSNTPAYSCTKCLNFLHKTCAELPQKIRHSCHSRHFLKLQVSKPQSCDLCCKKDCRLIFSCHETGCNLKIGTECAFLGTIVKCQSHDHVLSLVEKASCDNIQCDACRKSYKDLSCDHVIYDNHEVHRTKSFLFRCMECVFNLHFLCGPLPSTIKYDYHIHNLTLIDSCVEDDSGKEYCDACEEERNLQLRVYICANCKYVAHIHCLIPKIMKVIKRDMESGNDVELRALGEDRWKSAKELMDKAKEKIRFKKRNFRDIIDSLTTTERNMISQPFDLLEADIYRSQHEFYRERNSQFDQLGFDNFDRVKEFFYLDSSEFLQNIGREYVSYIPEESFKIEEKYLRQKIVKVEGNYMVPETLAPILITLLEKYGDLGGESSLTSGMKSVASTLLSIVIEKMCRTKVEDVTNDDLKNWVSYLKVIEKISGIKVNRYFACLEKVVEAYMGFKAIKCEKEIRENLDLKIATLKDELKRCEDELKRCEHNRKELETITSQKSSTIESFIREALKRKWKTVGDELF